VPALRQSLSADREGIVPLGFLLSTLGLLRVTRLTEYLLDRPTYFSASSIIVPTSGMY
jgi:hypothetical protein